MGGERVIGFQAELDLDPGPGLLPALCLASVHRAAGQGRCAPGSPEERSGCSVRLRFRAPRAPTQGEGRQHGDAEVLRREISAVVPVAVAPLLLFATVGSGMRIPPSAGHDAGAPGRGCWTKASPRGSGNRPPNPGRCPPGRGRGIERTFPRGAGSSL